MEIVEEKLIDLFRSLVPDYAGEKILLAVSGGVDSMVCATIFKKYKYPITLVHCNFQLRKKDSDADALLVKKWATKNKVPHIEKKFKVKKVKGESLQMTARNIRYQWFNELASKENFAYIITAHHMNDSIETSLMNMIRGTGISGLTGIPPRNGMIVRPMMNVFRTEIEAYAKRKKIAWRLDKSNLITKYKRNKIRHELLPILTKYNPNFLEVYAQNIYNWQSISKVYKQAVARLRTELVHFDEAIGGFKISALELIARGITDEIMYELVNEFGFNSDQATQIIDSLKTHSGKKFYSADHILLIDRLFIIIKPLDLIPENESKAIISNDLPFESSQWEIKLVNVKNLATLHTGPHEMLLDHKKLTWPIKLRKWLPGDKFTPMGMKGKKKVSDFLTDHKVDRFKKDDTWVVESNNGDITGVIGYRPDENFKISKNTKHCIYIKRKTLYF